MQSPSDKRPQVAADAETSSPVLQLQSRPSIAGRAFLAAALLVGFYVLALAIAIGLLAVPVLQFIYLQRVTFNLALFCVIGGVLILWSIIPRPDKFIPPGPMLKPDEQPRLYEAIREVAHRTGQEMPAEVYLIPDVNAFVSQRGGVLGFGGRRVMGIGLALLSMLTVSQFKAVLAHEFGHYYGGDTKLGPWIYRTREAIGRTLHNLARHSSLLQKPFFWYGKMFLRITHSISRRQEFVADELSAPIAGVKAAIAGLRAVYGGSLAFDAFWRSELAPVLSSGYRPPLMEGFSRFASSAIISEAVSKSVETELKEGRSDIYDTHPSLPERLAALESLTPGEQPHRPEDEKDMRAISLVNNVEELEQALLVALGGEEAARDLKPATWEIATRGAYLPVWEEMARSSAHLLAGATVKDLPQLSRQVDKFGRAMLQLEEEEAADVEEAAGDEMPEPLLEEMVEPGQEVIDLEEEEFSLDEALAERTIGALGSSFAVALHRQGWELSSLPGEQVYFRRDGSQVAPFEVVEKLVRRELDGNAWQQQCAQIGICDLKLEVLLDAS